MNPFLSIAMRTLGMAGPVVLMSIACQQVIERPSSRPDNGTVDTGSLEVTKNVAAGESAELEIRASRIFIPTGATQSDVKVRMRVLSAAPEREETAALGDPKGDVVEVAFYDEATEEIFSSSLFDAPYQVEQSLEDVEDASNLNYVVIANPDTDDETISLVSSDGIVVEDVSLRLSALVASIDLKVTYAVFYAIEADPDAKGSLQTISSAQDIENDGGTSIPTSDNGNANTNNNSNSNSSAEEDPNAGVLWPTKTLALNNSTSCYVVPDSGELKCWGRSDFTLTGTDDGGNFGDAPGEIANLQASDYGSNLDLLSISSRDNHICALLQNTSGDNLVKCWGSCVQGRTGNYFGGTQFVMGDQSTETGDNLLAANLGSRPKPIQVAVGSHSTCILHEDSTISCFGIDVGDNGVMGPSFTDTAFGAVGDAANEMGDALPLLSLGDEEILYLVAGDRAYCALFANRKVKCWGSGVRGKLGLESTDNMGDNAGELGNDLPFLDFGITEPIVQLTMGDSHGCVLFEDGKVKCWGMNQHGQLGYGDAIDRGDTPGSMGENLPYVNVDAVRKVKQIAAGSNFTCAVLEDDAAKCWGNDGAGNLGQGANLPASSTFDKTPSELADIDFGTGRTVRYLVTGHGHTCAVLDNDALKCWGYNWYGQVGFGSTDNIGDGAGEMGNDLPELPL